MVFSKTELNVLRQIALGNKQINEIATALKKDRSQIYRTIQKLNQKHYVILDKTVVSPSEKTHVQILLRELSKQSSFINVIQGVGLRLLLFILENSKSADEIINQTKIKRSTVFYKLKQAQRLNIVKKDKNKYVFNKIIWQGLYDFLSQLQKHEWTYDKRIPSGSTIYMKNEREILFSTKLKSDAELTGFNKYEKYGIKIYNIDYMYYLPKKNLTKKDILLHSIYRVEKEKNIQDMILTTLFYVKFKKEFSEIQHEFLENINKVLKKQTIKNYPSYEEIKDKAEMYGIKIK